MSIIKTRSGLALQSRAVLSLTLMALVTTVWGVDTPDGENTPSPNSNVSEQSLTPGQVHCANLVYGDGKSSVCFSSEFLKEIKRKTHINASHKLIPVQADSTRLFQFPFAVMTGEGTFTLTPAQRENLRSYLSSGGFVVASAGCSSSEWEQSFKQEIRLIFPELTTIPLAQSHPLFHTVYEIASLDCRRANVKAQLNGLEIDGKIVLVFSADGLNDTSKVGGNCCCCGGNEISNARQVNVNLLAYALTH